MGTLNLATFEKSRLWAGTVFHLFPSFHHHPTQHNNTTQTVTLTVTLTSTFPVYYTDTHATHNVVCPSSAWFENRPHLTSSIHLAWNPKHIIVQWVGISAHTHTPHFYVPSVYSSRTQSMFIYTCSPQYFLREIIFIVIIIRNNTEVLIFCQVVTTACAGRSTQTRYIENLMFRSIG